MKLDFAALLALLHENRVMFIVVGGIACALNGFVRTTEDVDILVEDSPDNIRNLLHILTQWGNGCARELSPGDFSPEPGAVRLIEDFPLDMFTVLAGRSYTDFAPSCRKAAGGYRFLCPDDLVKTKQHTQREKDQIDILALRRIAREQAADS